MRCFVKKPSGKLITFKYLLLALATFSTSVLSESRSLLIGIDQYPTLRKSSELNGPANDVALVESVLMARGAKQNSIQKLGSKFGATATYNAIQNALKDLISKSAAGDEVLIYFSGHGARQPAFNPVQTAEIDGLDEILLPADVGRWNRTTRQIDRAITDKQISATLNAITAKGAFVWLIVDACHAASISRRPTRLSTLGRRAKAISLYDIGYTGPTLASYRPAKPKAQSAMPPNYLGFFAAGEDEFAFEELMPNADEGAKRSHGVFTWYLAKALREQPKIIDYAALQLRIKTLYQVDNRVFPIPVFEGEIVKNSAAYGLQK